MHVNTAIVKPIDVNVALGRWPFHRFDLNSAQTLEDHLISEGIGEAWVTSIEAVLDPDVDACDADLLAALAGRPTLRAVKTVNPMLGSWRDSVAVAVDAGLHAIRIVPTYHQYTLTDERLLLLMEAAERHGLLVMVQMRVDDERNQYPLMKVPGVRAADLAALARQHSHLRFLALCTYFNELSALAEESNISVELSFLERFETVRTVLSQIPDNRLLFGSYTPMLYTRSAIMKWDLADVPQATKTRIAHTNALGLRAPAEV